MKPWSEVWVFSVSEETGSILRGDSSPRGADDIMGASIFGGDMGHWWWWWWWCVSTWGFPSARGRRRTRRENISEGRKEWLWGLGRSVNVSASIIWSLRLVHDAAITRAQGPRLISNDLICLLLHWFIQQQKKRAINEEEFPQQGQQICLNTWVYN